MNNNTETNFIDVINGKESLKFEFQFETKSIIILCLAAFVTATAIIMIAKK